MTAVSLAPLGAKAGKPLAGLRPVAELAAARQHGDRLRYMAGCRCTECRRANTEYEKTRARARKAGDWNGLVAAEGARLHLLQLSKANVGRDQVSDAAGVSVTIVAKIAAGTRKKIRARTEKSILAVTVAAAADGALVDAGPTWKLLDDLLSCGYSKAQLARELGYKVPALQFKRTQCTVRNAYEVQQLHARLRCVPAKPTLALIAELREEGFRQDRIESMLRELATRSNVPAPDLAVRQGTMRAGTADLVQRLHKDLTQEPV
jgi:hypothetical protein